jgi:O-antigen ligase
VTVNPIELDSRAASVVQRKPRVSVRASAADRMDLSLLLLIPAILTNIWFWQLILPGLSSLKLGILTVVLAAAAFAASPHRLSLFGDPLRYPMRLLMVLGGLAFLGAPFAIVRGAAVDFLIYFFLPSFFLALLVAARVRTEYTLRFTIDGILFGGLLYAWHFMQAPLDSGGKPYGTQFYDANDGAMMGVVCLVLAVGRLASVRTMIARVAYSGVAVAFLAMVVRSSSRGALLSLVLTVLLVLFTAKAVPIRVRVGTVVAGASLLLLLGSSSYWSLMSSLLEPEKDYNWAGNSDTGRIELWKRGFGYMLEDPLLGAGAMNYANKEGRSKWAQEAALEGRGAKWSVAHNAYVAVGVELGIPGLITYVSMLWIAVGNLRRAARSPGPSRSLRSLLEFQLASIYAFCFASIFISSHYWTFCYVMVALATSGAVAARDQSRRSSPDGQPLPRGAAARLRSHPPRARAAGGFRQGPSQVMG